LFVSTLELAASDGAAPLQQQSQGRLRRLRLDGGDVRHRSSSSTSRSLRLSEGDFAILFSSPLANTLWGLLVLSLLLPFWRGWRQRKALAAAQFGDER
jgi:outer membrane protein TolC